jgi:hypothetical protein
MGTVGSQQLCGEVLHNRKLNGNSARNSVPRDRHAHGIASCWDPGLKGNHCMLRIIIACLNVLIIYE